MGALQMVLEMVDGFGVYQYGVRGAWEWMWAVQRFDLRAAH